MSKGPVFHVMQSELKKRGRGGETMTNPVEHPKHYNSHPSGIECITIVQHHNFNVGNAIKYLWRCGLKEGEDEETALKKARVYIDFELDRVISKSLGKADP